jgi:hypothetical protein
MPFCTRGTVTLIKEPASVDIAEAEHEMSSATEGVALALYKICYAKFKQFSKSKVYPRLKHCSVTQSLD